MNRSFLDVPQGPADLITGQRYRIVVGVEFVGTFKGVRQDGQYVFETRGKVAGIGTGAQPATRAVDPDLIVGIGESRRQS